MRRPRRPPGRSRGAAVLGLVVGLSLGSTALGGGPAATAGAAAPPAGMTRLVANRLGVTPDTLTLPGRIGAPLDVLQMVTVTSPTWRSTVGTLKAWQRDPGGHWSSVRGPVQVVLGYAGWVVAAQRVQSSGTSPAGRFTLPAAFGLDPDPGTALPYRRVHENDWWPYEPRDPATYNIYQTHRDSHSTWRADFSEHLASYRGQYDDAIVVGFNLPRGVHYSAKRDQRVARHRADTRIGGGIFLHVRATGATEGCIAMQQLQVRWLLRWLRPAQDPEIVMGPYGYVLTL